MSTIGCTLNIRLFLHLIVCCQRSILSFISLSLFLSPIKSFFSLNNSYLGQPTTYWMVQQQQGTRLNGRHVGEGATLQQKYELNSVGRRKIHSLIFERLALFFVDVIFMGCVLGSICIVLCRYNLFSLMDMKV